MQRPRGLPAAQRVDSGRNRGIEGGRHREARPNHQWKQDEDYGQIRAALHYVVRVGLRFLRRRAAKIPRDHLPERRHVLSADAGNRSFRRWPVHRLEIA